MFLDGSFDLPGGENDGSVGFIGIGFDSKEPIGLDFSENEEIVWRVVITVGTFAYWLVLSEFLWPRRESS